MSQFYNGDQFFKFYLEVGNTLDKTKLISSDEVPSSLESHSTIIPRVPLTK